MKIFNALSFLIAMLWLVSCDKDENSNKPPSLPSLVSPSENSTIVGLETDLNWEACTDSDGDKITYDVYLGTDANPTVAVATDIDTNYFISNNLTNNSTYYWKVVSKDEFSEAESSEIRSFKTNAILGNWESDTIVHPQYEIKFVQLHTFNEDGTGSLQQTGGLTDSYSLTWSVDGNSLSFNLIGTDYIDTVYHAFENYGNTMIFKESEVTPEVEARFNRVEE